MKNADVAVTKAVKGGRIKGGTRGCHSRKRKTALKAVRRSMRGERADKAVWKAAILAPREQIEKEENPPKGGMENKTH